MDVDEEGRQAGRSGELKIRGQAEVERRKSKWDEEPSYSSGASSNTPQDELEKRENELKERALRQKVMRSRKAT